MVGCSVWQLVGRISWHNWQVLPLSFGEAYWLTYFAGLKNQLLGLFGWADKSKGLSLLGLLRRLVGLAGWWGWSAGQISQRSLVCFAGWLDCTVGQNNQEYRLKYLATRLSVHSFNCIAHSFACSGLLALLAPSAVLTRSLACSLRSFPRSWESGKVMSRDDLVLYHSARLTETRPRVSGPLCPSVCSSVYPS